MPTVSRRRILELLAATPLAACAGEALPDPAAAWRAPGAAATDPRLYALAHAILAPNPHNRQPWLVSLAGADEVLFYPDLERLLPATDPPNRQIVLGCGAFLELFDLAARERGFRAEIALWPEGEPQPVLDGRPVARIRLVQDATVTGDPLFGQILARRTNREPYDLARTPAAVDLDAISAAAAGPGLAAGWTNAAGEAAGLRDLVWRGWAKEAATPAALKESVDVMRLGKAEIATHRDGISLDFPTLPLLKAAGIVTREKLLDPNSEANKQGAAMWRDMAETAPAFWWLKSADNTRVTQIAAGRAYARANLEAAARGLAMHPWSMSLQEYPEMAALYAETQQRFAATPTSPVQMLVRIGYGPSIPPAPRRGLDQHLRQA